MDLDILDYKILEFAANEEIPLPEEKQVETAGAIIDREAVLTALRRNGGNASRTAKELGISRSTLYRRLK